MASFTVFPFREEVLKHGFSVARRVHHDTFFCVTFMVLAPESELVGTLTKPEKQAEVATYLDYVKKRTSSIA